MAISLRLPFPGTWSSYPIVQGYGATNNFAEPAEHGYAHWHQGIDFGLPCGAEVTAAGPGTVISNGTQDGTFGYGPYHVVIDHGAGANGVQVYSLYGHLADNVVSAGDPVTAGQLIGHCGSLGNSYGCHLHFTVYTPMYRDVDPGPYLTGQAAVNYGAGAASQTGILSPEMIAYYAWNAGIPPSQLVTAVAIALAESGGQVTAQNSIGATGLWQILVSAHPTYDATRLKTDPAYNAQAMAAISNKGTDWTPWETYTSGPPIVHGHPTYDGPGRGMYRTFLPQARAGVAAYTPGTVPADLTADIGGNPDYGQPQVSWLPVDTTPQQPVTQYAIRPTTVAPGTLAPDALRRFPTAAVWVQDHWLPVAAASVTTTQFLTPGSYSATLNIDDVVERIGADGLEQIVASGRTEAVIAMGYRPAIDAPIDPTTLTRMIVGILDAPKPHYENATRTIAFSGADLSAIHADGSATDSELGTTVQNMRSDRWVRQLVTAHNESGYDGLSVDAPQAGAGTIGHLFGGGTAQIRVSGTTEWDMITQAAAGEGFVAFYQGTVLYYGPYPASASMTPLVLGYNVRGQEASVVLAVDPVINPHNARDYLVTVTSYDTRQHKMVARSAGNHDATGAASIRVALPAGITGQRLQTRANQTLALYQAAERTLTLTLAHPVPLQTGQPIVLLSDEPGLRQFTGTAHRFYPTAVTYDYAASPPALTMTIQASCRPPSATNADTTLTG